MFSPFPKALIDPVTAVTSTSDAHDWGEEKNYFHSFTKNAVQNAK